MVVTNQIEHKGVNEMTKLINANSSGIAIKGHRGTWYVIESKMYASMNFLLEHEQYGQDAACLIVDEFGKVLLDDVHNGFDDYDYFLTEQMCCDPATGKCECGNKWESKWNKS